MNKFFIIFLFLSALTFSQVDSSECEKLNEYFQEKSNVHSVWVEHMPEMIGGFDSLNSLIHYPASALKDSVEGKVYILVVIDSLGNPICPSVIKAVNPALDNEALRVVMLMRFKPALYRGKPVTTPIALPIVFKLLD
jgi:TonB family protein